MVVGGARIVPANPLEPLGPVAPAPSQHVWREPTGFLWVELDQSGDRANTGTDVRELALEPVRGGPGVGVRACYEAVVEPPREQPLGGHIHARPPRRARARSRPIEQREPDRELARNPLGDLPGLVRARIEHQDHLELVPGHRLRAERGQAPRDVVLLVARGDDDDAR